MDARDEKVINEQIPDHIDYELKKRMEQICELISMNLDNLPYEYAYIIICGVTSAMIANVNGNIELSDEDLFNHFMKMTKDFYLDILKNERELNNDLD